MDEELQSKFIEHAKKCKSEDSGIEKCLLIKILDNRTKYGLLYVSCHGENLDNHCDSCKNEPPLFLRFACFNGFPEHMCAEIGKTKYERIINNEISLDNDLKMEILFDLLEK